MKNHLHHAAAYNLLVSPMLKNPIAFSAILLTLATPAWAETVSCPRLADSVQVGTCPSEEELQFTFSGYCSDNARMYDKPEEQLCTDYKLYRSMKNTVRHETADGRFSGYVSCEPGMSLTNARPVKIKVDKQGSVTRFACLYDNGATFTYRTKGKCVLAPGAADACARDAAACKAECD